MKHKLTINRLAWNTIRHRKKQYAVLIVSIVLAMIFSSGVPLFLSCIDASLSEMQQKRFGRHDQLLLPAQELPLEELQQNRSVIGEFGYIHALSYIWYGDNEDRGTELGWMDVRAQELYFPQLKQGRLPESNGEIAIEEDALLRMGLEPELNTKITFHAKPHDSAAYVNQTIDKSYTLVGILGNRRPIYEQFHQELGPYLPAAFVAPGEQTEIGGKESLIVLLEQDQSNPTAYAEYLNMVRDHSYGMTRKGNYGNAGMELMKNGNTIAFLSLLLAGLTCFSILNAFDTLLRERTTQIGMMRAVGATRRQIFWIFGRETLLLALVCAPLSLAISMGGIWLYGRYMGEDFVFAPQFPVLGAGLVFSLFCVIAAAMIPLFFVSRLTPMQAIRNVHLSKKMRHKKIKSRKSFRAPQLLATRKNTFSKGRSILVRLILVGTTAVCCATVTLFVISLKSMFLSTQQFDYVVYPTSGQIPDNAFIYSENESFLSEPQRQDLFDIPFVEDVYGTKSFQINLLLNEVPKSLQLFEMRGFVAGRFESADLFSNENLPMTEEKLFQISQATERPVYTETKARAGYQQEALTIGINAADSAHFMEMFPCRVVEGRINMDALISGEEVLLMTADKIGFSLRSYPDGSRSYGLNDLSPASLKKMSPMAKEDLDYMISTAENTFHAGDELTLSMLFEEPDGNLRRVDRTVKIGAIVQDMYANNAIFSLFTTNEALEFYGQDFPYDHLYVNCSEEFPSELDSEMQTILTATFPSKGILSTYEMNRSGQNTIRQQAISFASVILVLFVVCISLINNGITAQIREDRRSIGTLRAVGASQRDITQCYRLQIIRTLLWGTGIGIVFVFIGILRFVFISMR